MAPVPDDGLGWHVPWRHLPWIFVWMSLVASGVGLASTNRFEADVRVLEAAARTNPPPPGAVMFYGSSSLRLWPRAEAAFPGYRVVNHGFGGSQLADLIEYFDRLVVPFRPGLLLIYGGDNDLAAGKTTERVLADFKTLTAAVHRALPGTRVALLSIKPSPVREALLPVQKVTNERVRRFAAPRAGVDFVDVAACLLDREGRPDAGLFREDRLHLNGAGYERWTAVLAPYVKRYGIQASVVGSP